MQHHSRDPDTPSDLSAEEGDLAGWMGALPRYDAPPLVRARVLSGERSAAAAQLGSSGPASMARSGLLGRRALATAAALLIAVGATCFALVGQGDGDDSTATSGVSTPGVASTGTALDDVMHGVTSMQGSAMLHGLETFDHVGLDPHDVVANWGR